MIPRTTLLLLALALPITLGSAWAEGDAELPPPPPPPDAYPLYPGQQIYTAPLAQQTQTTYVPQSVALSGPEEIKDTEGRGVPAGYTPVYRKRKGLIIGGAVTLGVTYGYTALIAAIGEDLSSDGHNEVGALWIPVAGPFIQAAQTDSATGQFFLALSGGAQLAGAIMLYYGMTSPRRIFVRNDLVGSMTVSPMAGNGASGMVLSGRF